MSAVFTGRSLPLRSAFKLAAVLLLAAVGFVLGVAVAGQARESAGDRKEGWVDYDDLDQKDRLSTWSTPGAGWKVAWFDKQ